jgi:glycosyltransferase involved in cell wall biosynthesis
MAPGANAALVPCCVDTRTFRFDSRARERIRQANGWNARLVVVYEGNLGKWNDIRMYARYFSFILELRPEAHFLILTPSQDIDFVAVLGEYGIEESQFTVREVSPLELPHWLSAADLGLQVMPKVADSHTRLGVKFVEYLSCGLPVVVNSNVGGAAQIVEAYGVGIVVDLEDPLRLHEIQQFLDSVPPLRARGVSLAHELFSLQNCASRYRELYEGLRDRLN